MTRRVAVIGAGAIGVATAWELARDGAAVTVYEQRGGVASMASYGESGLLSPASTALSFGPDLTGGGLFGPLRTASWDGPGTLRRLNPLQRGKARAGAAAHRTRVLTLARAGRDGVQTLAHELGMELERSVGQLRLFRSERELQRCRPRLEALAANGVASDVVDAAGCRALEPYLDADAPLAGGARFATDWVVNARQFTQLLREQAQRLGVSFVFDTRVHAVQPGSAPVVRWHRVARNEVATLANDRGDSALERDAGPATQPARDDSGDATYDAVVVCASVGAAPLLRAQGLRLPLAGVRSYALTAPLRLSEMHPDLGPASAVVDAHSGVTISRLGQRLRVTGFVATGRHPGQPDERAYGRLHSVADEWFPGVADLNRAQRWNGVHATLPDTPVLGASGLPGVWLNLGHGRHSWPLACGAARVLSQCVHGQPTPWWPALDTRAA